jgi:hypothetical protein
MLVMWTLWCYPVSHISTQLGLTLHHTHRCSIGEPAAARACTRRHVFTTSIPPGDCMVVGARGYSTAHHVKRDGTSMQYTVRPPPQTRPLTCRCRLKQHWHATEVNQPYHVLRSTNHANVSCNFCRNASCHDLSALKSLVKRSSVHSLVHQTLSGSR